MDKQNRLDEFKKECAEDIDSVNISIEKLKKLKISSSFYQSFQVHKKGYLPLVG